LRRNNGQNDNLGQRDKKRGRVEFPPRKAPTISGMMTTEARNP
jgi:hypothetical protein